MKLFILVSLMSIGLSAQALEKDRGGGVVPYAAGTATVSLSWRYRTQSF